LRRLAISDSLDRREYETMRRASTLLLAGLLVTGGGATTGCSSSTTTHGVERPATNEEGATQTETTTTETHETSGPGVGIVSGTVHVIGMILALPFKIVGGLIELIF
jgi:hypothetical protein